MFWTDLDLTTGVLYLPRLDALGDDAVISNSDSSIFIQVSEAFRLVWTQGPLSYFDQDLLESIVVLGKEFCEFIRAGQGRVQVFEKSSSTDLVTEIDSGIEMLFRIWMSRFLPEDRIIGEEGAKDVIGYDDTVWYVDPVDGTSNYVDGSPYVGINIGCLKAGKPFLAFVGAPFDFTYFYGISEQNFIFKETTTEKVILSPAYAAGMVIGTEFRKGNAVAERHLMHILSQLSGESLHLRCIAIQLMKLIEGETTAFYQYHVKMWDIMAPLILHSFMYGDTFGYEVILDCDDLNTRMPLFGQDRRLVDWLNQTQNVNKSVDICIVYPTKNPTIRDVIESEFCH